MNILFYTFRVLYDLPYINLPNWHTVFLNYETIILVEGGSLSSNLDGLFNFTVVEPALLSDQPRIKIFYGRLQ